MRRCWACDAVGAWQVGDTKMKENREVCGLVKGSEARVGVVEHVAVVGVDPPSYGRLGITLPQNAYAELILANKNCSCIINQFGKIRNCNCISK